MIQKATQGSGDQCGSQSAAQRRPAQAQAQVDWKSLYVFDERKYSHKLITAPWLKSAETSFSMAFVVMCAEKNPRLFRL
jgi:hypothetical protein